MSSHVSAAWGGTGDAARAAERDHGCAPNGKQGSGIPGETSDGSLSP